MKYFKKEAKKKENTGAIAATTAAAAAGGMFLIDDANKAREAAQASFNSTLWNTPNYGKSTMHVPNFNAGAKGAEVAAKGAKAGSKVKKVVQTALKVV